MKLPGDENRGRNENNVVCRNSDFLLGNVQFLFGAIPEIQLPKTNDSKPTQSQTDQSQTTTTVLAPKSALATQAFVNQPSIQITLRTHQQYYRGAQGRSRHVELDAAN